MKQRQSNASLKERHFHILLSLADRSLHGLQIMEDVSTRTHGELHLWPGALYGSLRYLSEEGLIEETPPPEDAEAGGGRPRYYRITPEGRRVLAIEVTRLTHFVATALAKNIT